MVGAGLTLAVLAVYSSVIHFGYVDFDDDVGLFKNPIVSGGLTQAGIAWAFTTYHLGNWIPITWLSHMLDFTLFGAQPGWHHLVNVLIHAANTLLLFGLLVRVRRGVWPAAAVAALFALHPLRVESVAWLIERKDVLSALAWLATIWLYVSYVEQQTSRGRYLAVIVVFALGLAVKPMLVTLPFVLLLLDVWPLQRVTHPWLRVRQRDATGRGMGIGSTGGTSGAGGTGGTGGTGDAGGAGGVRSGSSPASASPEPRGSTIGRSGGSEQRSGAPLPPWRLVTEKLPLFAIAAASSLLTVRAQRHGGAVRSLVQIPLPTRLTNALVAYTEYIVKTVWPSGLAVYYPYRLHLPSWEILGSCLFLSAATLGALFAVRRYPFVMVGWFWYLGTLVPVIGIVQVGAMAMADRYTYIPSIGLAILAVELPLALTAGRPALRPLLGAAAAGAALVLAVLSWNQVQYWRSSSALFERALAVTSDNALAHYNLATALAQESKIDEAIAQYRETLRIAPVFADANQNLALALFNQGKTEEAIGYYRAELALNPNHPEAHCHLGVALAVQGHFPEALAQFQDAARVKPDYADAYYNMALAYERLGRPDDAIGAYSKTLALAPDNPDALFNLAMLFDQRGRLGEAESLLVSLLRIAPGYPGASDQLRAIRGRSSSGGR